MKLTIKELNEKLQLVGQINQKSDGLEINDKLTYAIKKLQSRAGKAVEEKRNDIQNRISDLYLEYAATDEKGILKEENGQYQYSKEDKIKLVQAIRNLNKEFDSATIEFEPFQVGPAQAPRILTIDEFLVDEIGLVLFTPDSFSSSEKVVASDVPPGKTYPPPPVQP